MTNMDPARDGFFFESESPFLRTGGVQFQVPWFFKGNLKNHCTLRILGMSWGVKTTCLEAPGVSLGGSGVSIGGVRSLRVNTLPETNSKSSHNCPKGKGSSIIL